MIGQLTTRKYIFSGAPSKLKLESKESLKKRGLTSRTGLMQLHWHYTRAEFLMSAV